MMPIIISRYNDDCGSAALHGGVTRILETTKHYFINQSVKSQTIHQVWYTVPLVPKKMAGIWCTRGLTWV